MKMKRIFAAFLAAIMLVTMLSACGASDATKEFFALNEAIQDIHSGTFHEDVTITVPKALSQNILLNRIGLPMEDLDEDMEISGIIDMSIDCDKELAEISLTGSYGGKDPMKVTTIYIEGETGYLNVVELLNFIQNGLEMGDALNMPSEGWEEQVAEQMEGKEYAIVFTSMDIDLWDILDGKGTSEFIDILMDALKSSANENKLVSTTDNANAKYYTLSISNETFSPAAAAVLDYLQENEDKFLEAASDYLEAMDTNTTLDPKSLDLTEEDWTDLKEYVSELDIPDFSLSCGLRYDKKAKEYSRIFDLDIPNVIQIKTAGTVSSQVPAINIPDAYDYSNDLELPTVLPEFDDAPLLQDPVQGTVTNPAVSDNLTVPDAPAVPSANASGDDVEQMLQAVKVDIKESRLYKGLPFTASWDDDGAEVLSIAERLIAESFPAFEISFSTGDEERISLEAFEGDEYGTRVEISLCRNGGAAADYNYTALEVILCFDTLSEAESILPTFVETLQQCGYTVDPDAIRPILTYMYNNASVLVTDGEYGSFIALSHNQDPIELCAYISSHGSEGYSYQLSIAE